MRYELILIEIRVVSNWNHPYILTRCSWVNVAVSDFAQFPAALPYAVVQWKLPVLVAVSKETVA